MRRQTDRGFTLVELLVVVVVVGLLAAIAVPTLGLALARARRAQGMAFLRILEQDEMRYQLDTGTFYPDPGAAVASLVPVLAPPSSTTVVVPSGTPLALEGSRERRTVPRPYDLSILVPGDGAFPSLTLTGNLDRDADLDILTAAGSGSVAVVSDDFTAPTSGSTGGGVESPGDAGDEDDGAPPPGDSADEDRDDHHGNHGGDDGRDGEDRDDRHGGDGDRGHHDGGHDGGHGGGSHRGDHGGKHGGKGDKDE